MADIFDETRTLRRRVAAIERGSSLDRSSHSSAALSVEVYDAGHIPTTVPNQFAVKPVRATGRIGEGLTATLATGPTGFIATFLGPRVPAAGDRFVVRQAGGRWVADGGPATTTSSCGGTACVSVGGCNAKSIDGATVTLASKTVIQINVTNGGSGYTAPPNVIVSNATGNGCVATATVAGGAVTGIVVTVGGAYSSTPGVTIAAVGGGSGATATAVLGPLTTLATGTTTGQVATITRTAAGSGYTSQPTVTITGDGSGATAVANITAPILSFNVDNAGHGYTTAPTAAVSTATGSGGSSRVLLAGTTVASVTPVAGGSYATSSGIPTVTLTTPTGHTGSGATAQAVMRATAVAVAAAGSGYSANDILTVSGGTASSPVTIKVLAVDGTGAITSAAGQAAGSYTASPASPSPVTGGTGVGATFNLTWTVDSFVVTNGGANYSTAPTVTMSGFGGATATSALTPTTIASVTKVAGGAYSSTPSVSLSGGGGGAGGAISATLDTFSVASFTLTSGGSGYTTAAATVSGGGGAGAAASVTVRNQACLAIPTAGTYTITATAPLGRFNTGTLTTALTCTSPQPVSITLTPASGYVCSSCSGCAYPAKQSLHATMPNGGTASFTLATGTSVTLTDTPYSLAVTCPGNTPGDVTFGYQVALAGGGFGCVNIIFNGYCSTTDPACIPRSDGNAVSAVWPCSISTGTLTVTCPENAGAFTYVLSGISYQNIFSGGTLTFTE